MEAMRDIDEQAPCLADDVVSPREREIIRYIAGGMRNADVARVLAISVRTVEKHLNNIFQKVEVRSRRELIGYARRVGII
jgi:DNA-binding CsgD family transcriptional regulator